MRGGMRGASEKPCAARLSLQLWLAVRHEQAKAEKRKKVANSHFFDTLCCKGPGTAFAFARTRIPR